jgi:hypothetical protein
MPDSQAGQSSTPSPVARNTSAPQSSVRSYGEYSEILRAAVADEESLQMGESLHALSAQIETLTEAWRLPHEDASWLAPHFLDLLDTLRDHHAMVLDLNRDWDRFLEFKAHMAAVNQFRSQLTQWAQLVRLPGAQAPLQSDFDVSAWRLLGAGALLLDVYEQSSKAGATTEASTSAWSRLVGWIRNTG